jgi:hypothetical protein
MPPVSRGRPQAPTLYPREPDRGKLLLQRLADHCNAGCSAKSSEAVVVDLFCVWIRIRHAG